MTYRQRCAEVWNLARKVWGFTTPAERWGAFLLLVAIAVLAAFGVAELLHIAGFVATEKTALGFLRTAESEV